MMKQSFLYESAPQKEIFFESDTSRACSNLLENQKTSSLSECAARALRHWKAQWLASALPLAIHVIHSVCTLVKAKMWIYASL